MASRSPWWWVPREAMAGAGTSLTKAQMSSSCQEAFGELMPGVPGACGHEHLCWKQRWGSEKNDRANLQVEVAPVSSLRPKQGWEEGAQVPWASA